MSARRMRRSGLYRSIVIAGIGGAAAVLGAACASGGSTDGGTSGPGGDAGAGGSSAGSGGTGTGATAGTGNGGTGTGATGGSGTGATGGAGQSGTGGASGSSAAGASGKSGVGGAGGAAGAAGSAGAAGASAGAAGKGGSAGGAGMGGTSAGASGSAGAGGACMPGGTCAVPNKLGECAKGVTACAGGVSTCKQVVFPGTELCDGKDNDCDGLIDNGPPWADATGMTCDTMLLGVCKAGTNLCTNGKIVCHQNVQPMPEVCNGLDDNCNGMIDEGSPGAGMDCLVSGINPVTPCAKGKTACDKTGQIACIETVFPTPELCNGIDDDCNGAIDDGLNGSPCDTKLPGICGGPSSGTLTCAAGVGNCVPKIAVGSQPEICNGKDDNCNGQIDEGDPNMLCKGTDPNATFVSQWACTAGTCTITMCALGHSDVDGAAGNGCECVTDSYATSCSGTGNGISVAAPGGVQKLTGVVEGAGGSKWFRVNFSNILAPGTPFHPKVSLTNDGAGAYQMDVQTDCATIATCGVNGTENGSKATTWEQDYSAYMPGPGCCSDATGRVAQVYVRVYLKANAMPSCTPFEVTATNP